jgi:hypothetical protein
MSCRSRWRRIVCKSEITRHFVTGPVDHAGPSYLLKQDFALSVTHLNKKLWRGVWFELWICDAAEIRTNGGERVGWFQRVLDELQPTRTFFPCSFRSR